MILTTKNTLWRSLIISVACSVLFSCANAQEAGNEDEEAPLSLVGNTETLSFTTDEGTWISLDVTPDGETIIFELLGDLYSLPITGGTATAITSGMGFDSQPRISPNGEHIAFISDRKGNDNVWIADIDGSNPRELTGAERIRVVSPEWTADGAYVAVTEVANKTNINLYHRVGGSGVALSPFGEEENINGIGVTMSSDGAAIYFAEPSGDDYPGAQIKRFDRATGRIAAITQGEGGGLRPAISPDGSKLAYITRDEAITRLRIRDLVSGADSELISGLQRDAQENGRLPSRDYFPGYSFTPDGSALIIPKNGKILRVELSDGSETEIPFTADISLDIGPDLTAAYRVDDGDVVAQIVHDPKLSPDGERIASSILGKIYTSPRDGSSAPTRLTNSDAMEYNPTWSPDGQHIAFVTWTDIDGGHIWRMPSNGLGTPTQLTQYPAFYTDLDWSPDGERIVAMRGNDWVRHQTFSEFPGLDTPMEFVHLPANGGAVAVIRPAEEGARDPHFTDSSQRLFAYTSEALVSMNLDGSAEQEHLKVQGPNRPGQEELTPAQQVLARPGGDWALALVNNQVWLVPMPPIGAATPQIKVRSPALPVKRLTDTGADFIGWSEDGEDILWAIGSTVFSRPFASIDFEPAEEGEEDESNAEEEQAIPESYESVSRTTIAVSVPRASGEGSLLLRNANVITMAGETTAEMTRSQSSSDILILDNRIQAVGPTGSLDVPDGTTTIDMTGKTIIPGLIDTHAHWEFRTQDVLEPHNWSLAANLAYGVTSGLDVQTNHKDYFTYRDWIDAGVSTGQRAFMTGPGIFSQTDFTSYERTLAYLKRYTEHYGTSNIKSYLVGNRQQRQWIVRAAKELGLMPTTEGGGDMRLDLTHAIDGMHGNEHTLPILPLRRDVIELYAQTQTAYTATLIVQYQAMGAIDYFFTRFNPHDDEKLARFYPENRIDELTRRRGSWAVEEEFAFRAAGNAAAELQRAGGLVGMGGHGELQGLGYHWELQAHEMGGMTPAEILRAATIDGAKIIGIAQDLGSLEAGKLADLLILNSDPLGSIENARDIQQVMKDGMLYDAGTLDRVWPDNAELAPFWWSE